MEAKYYLPIESKNLAQYFGSACVKPQRYFSNRKDDMKNQADDFLVLSTKMGFENTNCALEIVLTEDDKKELVELPGQRDIFLFSKPLPISRLKTILFNSESQKDQTLTSINISTAFIPLPLAKVVKKIDKVKFEIGNVPIDEKGKKWTEKLELFDRILGGFALMRLGGKDYMNYSDTYFSTLSLFNSVIETELINSEREVNRKFHDAFFGRDTLKILYPYLYKKITRNDFLEIAERENQKIAENKLTGLIDFTNLEKFTYIISMLNTYGVGDEARKMKADGLITSKFSLDVKPEKAELMSLYFGINKGYSAFSNKYQVGQNQQVVKFKLDSQLDYYTIESIYQFVFNGIYPSSEFSYLDNWCPRQTLPNRKLKKNEYVILDKVVIGRKILVGDSSWWANIFKYFFKDNQKELFKPFLEKFFEIIKRDIEEDFQDIVDEKDREIEKLKTENNQYTSFSIENKTLKENLNKLKTEMNELKVSRNSLVSDNEVKYEANNVLDHKQNDELLRFFKLLKESKNIGAVRKAIDDYLEKYNQSSISFGK